MSIKKISVCVAALSLLPGLALADEIESNFMAGYRMGFFMAVAAGNTHKVCGNVHFVSMQPVIKEYVTSHTPNYPLKFDEVLELEAKSFSCPKAPATPDKAE